MEEHENNGEATVGGATKVIIIMLGWKLFLSPLVSSSHEEGDFSLCAHDLRLSG
jgi:hypothetical protein